MCHALSDRGKRKTLQALYRNNRDELCSRFTSATVRSHLIHETPRRDFGSKCRLALRVLSLQDNHKTNYLGEMSVGAVHLRSFGPGVRCCAMPNLIFPLGLVFKLIRPFICFKPPLELLLRGCYQALTTVPAGNIEDLISHLCYDDLHSILWHDGAS